MMDKVDIMPFELTSEFILYTTPNGAVQILWLTQDSVVSKMETTALDGRCEGYL